MRILLAVLASLFIAMITQFTPAIAATGPAQDQSCALMSEGIYHGSWMKHRIVVGENVLFGANDLDAILSQLESLRGQGLCR